MSYQSDRVKIFNLFNLRPSAWFVESWAIKFKLDNTN